MKFKSVFVAMFAVLLAACNPMAQLDGAERKIERFHEVFNDGNARALYGLTSDEFREVSTPEQMDGLVALVTERLGKVESTERSGFNLNTNNGLTVSTITMTTQFEKAEATETYTFYGTDDDLRIVGWHVDSPVFEDLPVTEDAPAEEEEAEPAE